MNWKLFLDSQEEGICITTPHYSVVYLNPSLKDLLLLKEKTPSHPCYKVLFGRKEPCPFCPQPHELKEGFHTKKYLSKPLPLHVTLKAVREPQKGILRLAVFMELSPNITLEQGEGREKVTPFPRTRILLIDDNELLREMGEEILDHLGYTPLLASGGEEGIEMFKKGLGEIGLVLLDVVMPGMGGLETFRKLKEMDPQVNVLVISSYSEAEQVEAILKEGALGLIQKPFQIKALSNTLWEILEK